MRALLALILLGGCVEFEDPQAVMVNFCSREVWEPCTPEERAKAEMALAAGGAMDTVVRVRLILPPPPPEVEVYYEDEGPTLSPLPVGIPIGGGLYINP